MCVVVTGYILNRRNKTKFIREINSLFAQIRSKKMCPRFRTRFLRNMEPIKRVEQSASRSRTRMIIVECLNDHLLKSSISSWKGVGKLNWMPSRNKNFCHFMIFCYASIAWQSCLSKRMSKMESSWRSGSVGDFQTTLSYKRRGNETDFHREVLEKYQYPLECIHDSWATPAEPSPHHSSVRSRKM